MKRIIIYGIFSFAFHSLQGQRLPEFVQQRLDTAKQEARMALDEYRLCENYRKCEGKLPYANHIHNIFSYEERDRIDSLGLDISMSMIFDDAMRDRLAELMQNKYQEYELDTLINRRIANDVSRLEQKALAICQFDTLQIFKTALNSFYINLEPKTMSKNMYKHPVLKLLQLDTTTVFKQSYQIAVAKDRERVREEYINGTYYYHTDLAELCGYIGDKRFIQPLIKALEKPDNFNREKVIEALARMRVEPYYNDYVKFRMPRTLEKVKTERIHTEEFNFEIEDFVYVIGTQEAYWELSKYLLSDLAYRWDMADVVYGVEATSHSYSSPICSTAFSLIRDYVQNEDLQAMVKNKDYRDNPEILQLVYDWMQKNYGKYKIKRIW